MNRPQGVAQHNLGIRLAHRRCHILQHLANGHDGNGMAALLGVTTAQVRADIVWLRKWLGAANHAHLVARALTVGWLQVDGTLLRATPGCLYLLQSLENRPVTDRALFDRINTPEVTAS